MFISFIFGLLIQSIFQCRPRAFWLGHLSPSPISLICFSCPFSFQISKFRRSDVQPLGKKKEKHINTDQNYTLRYSQKIKLDRANDQPVIGLFSFDLPHTHSQPTKQNQTFFPPSRHFVSKTETPLPHFIWIGGDMEVDVPYVIDRLRPVCFRSECFTIYQ